MNITDSVKEHALGCLWGLAIGDAMGMPTSFLTPREIQHHFGVIQDFQPPLPGHRFHEGLDAAHVTDDTEQALVLARSFLRCGRVDPNDLVTELRDWAHRVTGTYASPLGPSTHRALEQIAAGTPLAEAGREGDTNGAAMRIAPLGILHGVRGSSLEELLGDVVLACMPTHGTDVAIAAAAAVAWAIALGVRERTSLQAILDGAGYAAERGQLLGFHVVAPSVAKRIHWAAEQSQNGAEPSKIVRDIYDLIGAGVAAASSVPAAFGVFAAARGDPRLAILLAANMGGDCDTIGAIAGALGGAFQGVTALPPQWIETIRRVNHLDFNDVVEGLMQSASHWQSASWQVSR